MTSAEKLAENQKVIGRLSVAMARCIEERLNTGDVVRAGIAAERLTRVASFATLDDLLCSLRRGDASHWLNLVMMYWGRSSDDLRTATGMDRQQWLDLERKLRP